MACENWVSERRISWIAKIVTAIRNGISVEVSRQTRFVAGLPAATGVGGDPGPHTSLGVFLGIKAAVRRALGKDSLAGLHIALQGAGSVATGVAPHDAADRPKVPGPVATRRRGGSCLGFPAGRWWVSITCPARRSSNSGVGTARGPEPVLMIAAAGNNRLWTPRVLSSG